MLQNYAICYTITPFSAIIIAPKTLSWPLYKFRSILFVFYILDLEMRQDLFQIFIFLMPFYVHRIIILQGF
jgi:hypothetical protein